MSHSPKSGLERLSGLEVRAQLERILASPVFANAGRMSRFLRFTVEKVLASRPGELKEYAIGVEVFDRRPDYDPRLDPVVRVEARRLRSKLSEYYDRHAKANELRIRLPKGSYVPEFGDETEAAPAAAAPAAVPPAVAVLRFANLTGDPETGYFSDGLTQELIHRVTALESPRVVAWNTAARIIGSEQEVLRSARELGITAVLTGSVRTAGDRLRVMAQMIDTATGTYLWSETYDRRLEDIFAIQDEISAAIARTLVQRLGASGPLPAPRGTRSFAAYKLYLQGRHHWNMRTDDGLRRSLELFREAAAIDPSFAGAHAGISDAWALLVDYTLVLPGEGMPQARAAAERALELDPELAEAYTSLGLIQAHYDWEWGKAESSFRHAIRLHPGYATAHHWYGIDYLALLGRFAEARAELALAADLDPLSHIIVEGIGMLNMFERKYDEAIEQFRAASDIDPRFYKPYAGIGRTRILQGDIPGAIELLEKARAMAPDVPHTLGALGQAYGLAGHRDRALEVLGRIEEIATRRYVPFSTRAIVNLGLGDLDRALDFLEQGCQRRDMTTTSIAVHPLYDPLRGDPRFQQLLAKLNLPD